MGKLLSTRFMRAHEEIKGYTLLTPDRCWHIWDAVMGIRNLPGDMAECGTYKGGSAKLIYKTAGGDKALHVFDTFEGIPAEQREEGDHTAGDFAIPMEEVEAYLYDCPGVKLYKGLVPNSLEAVRGKQFCFVYLDMDLYLPTFDALRFFWPRLVKGGVVMLDDVGHLDGVDKALGHFMGLLGMSGWTKINTTDWQIKLTKTADF